MDIRPLIFVDFSSFSGGVKRTFNVLKRGKSYGIDYIVVFNRKDYQRAVKYFPSFNKVIDQYRFYMLDWPAIYGNPLLIRYKNLVKLACTIAKIAERENVDLIVSPSETYTKFLLSYLTGTFSNKPWTSIFQQPPMGIYGILNSKNVLLDFNTALRHPYWSAQRLWMLLTQLKVSENTLILTISRSIEEELKMLNSKINVYVIEPGCGVNSVDYHLETLRKKYDAIFFARLIPEKGFLDLPEIWSIVTKEKPKAKLIVCGIVEDEKWVSDFFKLVKEYKISHNILFLGQKTEKDLLHSMKTSRLLVYPSSIDAFPLTILETLACGNPVVAYDIPAIRLNYRECKAVKTVRTKDKQKMAEYILSILNLNDLDRVKLSYNAKSFAERYTWKEVVKAEKNAYIKVLDYFNSITT